MTVLLNPYRFGGGGGGGYDADATAYFAAMTVQPDATRKGLINTLIIDLKADGVWSLLDWFSLLAAHDAQAGRLNAKTPSKILSAINSPVFTTDRGYAGDGVSAYLDTVESVLASGNVLTANSATAGAWANLQGSSAEGAHIGQTGTFRITYRPNTGVNGSFRVGDSTNTTYTKAAGRVGHTTVVRPDASNKTIFTAGGSKETFALAGNGVATNLFVSRVSTLYNDDRIAAMYYGAAFSDAQVASMHTRLSTYLTAIGAN